MKDGFVRCASATVDIKVADTDYNTSNIIKAIEDAAQNNIKLIVFPELCITGYTCGDLFLQKILIDSAKDSLIKIAKATEYAEKSGVYVNEEKVAGWWLRSPGDDSSLAAEVNDDGWVDRRGDDVDYDYDGVRPALYLKF